MGGGLFDFRVTPNPNFRLDVNLDLEFDNIVGYWIRIKVYFTVTQSHPNANKFNIIMVAVISTKRKLSSIFCDQFPNQRQNQTQLNIWE